MSDKPDYVRNLTVDQLADIVVETVKRAIVDRDRERDARTAKLEREVGDLKDRQLVLEAGAAVGTKHVAD